MMKKEEFGKERNFFIIKMLLLYGPSETELQISDHAYLKTLPGRLLLFESAKSESMTMESDRNIVLQSL